MTPRSHTYTKSLRKIVSVVLRRAAPTASSKYAAAALDRQKTFDETLQVPT